MIHSTFHGHPAIFVNGEWVYITPRPECCDNDNSCCMNNPVCSSSADGTKSCEDVCSEAGKNPPSPDTEDKICRSGENDPCPNDRFIYDYDGGEIIIYDNRRNYY